MAWWSVRKAQGQLYLYLKQIGCEDVDWIHLAQARVQWRAFMKTVVDLTVPWKKRRGIS
jgi:hypothetical protein